MESEEPLEALELDGDAPMEHDDVVAAEAEWALVQITQRRRRASVCDEEDAVHEYFCTWKDCATQLQESGWYSHETILQECSNAHAAIAAFDKRADMSATLNKSKLVTNASAGRTLERCMYGENAEGELLNILRTICREQSLEVIKYAMLDSHRKQLQKPFMEHWGKRDASFSLKPPLVFAGLDAEAGWNFLKDGLTVNPVALTTPEGFPNGALFVNEAPIRALDFVKATSSLVVACAFHFANEVANSVSGVTCKKLPNGWYSLEHHPPYAAESPRNFLKLLAPAAVMLIRAEQQYGSDMEAYAARDGVSVCVTDLF